MKLLYSVLLFLSIQFLVAQCQVPPAPLTSPAVPPIPIIAPPFSSSCSVCPAGHSSSPLCTNCPEGYCDEEAKCSLCPPGSEAPNQGTANCTICKAGFYAPNNGTINCTICSISYFCPQLAKGCTAMSLCPQGTYCPQRGMFFPFACPEGSYCPHNGMDRPLACPIGSYCPNQRTVAPVKCPKNYYCDQQYMIQPSQCQTLYGSPEGSVKCKPGPSFYILIIGCVVLVIAVIVGIYMYRVKFMVERANRISTRRRTDQTRLLAAREDSEEFTGYRGT